VSIEDELRRVMAEHDRQAPSAADLLRALEERAGTRELGPPRRGARWHVPLLAAASVAAVIVGSVWAGEVLGSAAGNPLAHESPLSCPARYAKPAPWVPAKPAGVDGRSRLVPRRTPWSALVCSYAGSNIGRQSGWALSGRRVLDGGLARLAAQLSRQPRKIPGQQIACTLVGGRQTNYIIGLTYPGGGVVWVAATVDPNACVTTSNGEFTSFGRIGLLTQRAFKTGLWPNRPRPSCKFWETGRLGQERAMVPAGVTSLLICTAHRVRMITSGYQPLVVRLNGLPKRPSIGGCSNTGRRGPYYRLLFSYPNGPPVWVDINVGCYPEIDNFSLQSNSASSVLPILSRLLRFP